MIALVTTTTAAPQPLVVWVDAARVGAVEDAARSFTSALGIPVEVVAVPLAEIRATVLSRRSGLTEPDVFYGSHTWLADLIAIGRIAPTGLGQRMNEFADVAADAFSFAGDDFGLPVAMHSTVFVYNRILVPDALIGFSQVKAACEDLAAQIVQIDKCVDVPTDDLANTYPFISAPGGYLLGNTGGVPDPGNIGIAGEGAIGGGEFLADLVADGVVSAASDLESALIRFYDRTSLFVIMGTRGIAIMSGTAPPPPSLAGRSAPFAVSTLPLMGGENPRSLIEVEGFYINRESLLADAAATFVRDYLASESTMAALFDAVPIPPAFNATAEVVRREPVMAALLDAAEGGSPIPPVANLDDVLAELTDAFSALYGSEVSVTEVLEGVAATVASLLDSGS